MKLCVDCIHVGVCYRQGAVDLNYADKCGDYEPYRHKAHWLRVTTVNPKEFCNRCSECGYEQFYAERYKFCPNCGAKIVEPQESEDKG